MKKLSAFIVLLAIILGYPSVCQGQVVMKIFKSDGTTEQISLPEIDSVMFRDTPPPPALIIHRNDGGNPPAVPLSEIDSIIYITSGCGGSITSITDIDGNTYATVQIGNQCWMQENLKTTRYANGSVIPNVTDDSVWEGLSTGAWCNYENNAGNGVTYGKLYNWYAVSTGNLCPTGWHVPSATEWTTLIDFLGGTSVGGGKMKATTGWNAPNAGATNESGFTGLPGGFRLYNGTFSGIGNSGYWWNSTEYDALNAWNGYLYYEYSNVYRNYNEGRVALSVRCLRD